MGCCTSSLVGLHCMGRFNVALSWGGSYVTNIYIHTHSIEIHFYTLLIDSNTFFLIF